MKILISSYSCETGRGSEGEIGWRMVVELAKHHDVRVITRANLREVHAASFTEDPPPAGLRFEYFDLPWIFRFYKRGKRFFLVYYYLWQLGTGLHARRMLKREPADVLHHLVGGMDWMPAGLSLCPGPMVWGPVGSEDTHPVILRHQPFASRLKDRARRAVRWTLRTLDPFTRFTSTRTDVVLTHTPETLPRRLTPKLRPFTQTGIADHPSLARPKTDLSRGARLRLVYAGELKDWKGARMALDAALGAIERGVDAELTVIGDGPLRTEMEAATRAHPHGSRVRFLGKVPMARLVDDLHQGDLFLYPSFHHGLSTIVLQAMLTGLPIICIEGDATGRAVGQEAGITVPLTEARRPSEGLADAIEALASDDVRRQKLGRAARRLALQDYSYAELARRIDAVYREVGGAA
ncbi:MAG: glycosyltransferase family 4 protein [Maritimibacter sp.]|nr:glycosyltransferase family 4 protein [Maritimibacter sp.]